MSEDFDTSIPLKLEFFEMMKNEDKWIHIDKKKYDVEPGGLIRFMKGYNPKNGVVLRRVLYIRNIIPVRLTVDELQRANVTVEWIEDYFDNLLKGCWVYYLEYPDENSHQNLCGGSDA